MERNIHTIGEYLELLERRGLLAGPVPEDLDRSAPVELVSYDSRDVVPGTLFICKGAHFKEEFLQGAKEKGAMVYVSQVPYPGVDLPCILVNDLRLTIAPLADFFYNHPSGDVKVVGLTGTKGKSTTAFFLNHILDSYLTRTGKPRSALISSIRLYDGVEDRATRMTTPEPLELQRSFANARDTGIGYLTMEVSSQALKYHRSLCSSFAVTCFLNIGKDHISPIEHPDFEDYFSSKLKIFDQGEVNCVNLDCDHADRVMEAARKAGKPIVTFSRKNKEADVYGDQIRKAGDDILFHVHTRRFSREFRLTIPGLFNVENALAAIAVCQVLDIPQQDIYTGLLNTRVPGRMEVYSSADDTITAIVDFAHNRMSFETLLRSMREEYPDRRIKIVFGCPGGKGLDRRRELGEVSGRYADRVILTEDDPASEDPMDICHEIEPYVAQSCSDYTIVLNRGEAIHRAIMECKEPTVLIVAGKGPEVNQSRKHGYEETPSDGEYVRSFLREYDLHRGLDGVNKARNLLAVLPALKPHMGTTLVARYCGSQEHSREAFLEDAAALRTLGVQVVLVQDLNVVDSLADLGVTGAGLSERTDPKTLKNLLEAGCLPVLSSSDPEETACRTAEALGAAELIFVTDGSCSGLERADVRRAQELLESGSLAQERVPYVRYCVRAAQNGVGKASLLDGQAEHTLLLSMLDQRVDGLSVTP